MRRLLLRLPQQSRRPMLLLLLLLLQRLQGPREAEQQLQQH